MVTISLFNMKGGVGKTTLAVNLGWNLARRKHQRVLIVDLDPQFNASQYLMDFDTWNNHRNAKGTIAGILLEAAEPRTVSKNPMQEIFLVERDKKTGGVLYLLPSDLRLTKAVKNPQGVEFRLARRMELLEEELDYVFIDCPPGDTVLTATALMASDYVLVPIRPDRFSVVGYGTMKEVLKAFRYDYPDPKHVEDLGVVFTQVRGGNPLEDQAKEEVSSQASYVFNTEIMMSNSYLRSVTAQTPVFDTVYARELTKKTIDSLVAEIETRIEAIIPKKHKKGKL